MSEELEKTQPPSGYRFLDATEDETASANDGRMIVEFYPSIEDLVHIAKANAKLYEQPRYAKLSLQAFLILNMAGLPAVLFFYNRLAAALLVCFLNLAFAIFVMPKILNADYRRLFNSIHPNFENELVKVELGAEGITCTARGDSSYHAWRNIRRIEETADAIYFFLRGSGFAVRKSGFAYDQEKERFLGFAKSHLRQLTPSDGTDGI